ncbi:Uu.00g115400.m01.CDS01 [Anthostomella pinea]|uniref:Uu.00g115400.m01.CDS01 n=1 Tax=Anthostomella pinea TaxID=933095 RepID=A0AAI8VGC8_9PEZI|nr:Uu.00g115400.m01.CDS01 [Anthostomella pinea]
MANTNNTPQNDLVVDHKTPKETRYYPSELKNDLKDSGLAPRVIEETLACAWEYTRCIIPEFTNWGRYLAFVRATVICIVVEFDETLVDMSVEDRLVLGYDVDAVLDTLFGGTRANGPSNDAMSRELRCFYLMTGDKASSRRDISQLFSRYVSALASSPRAWFRLRDTDALFTEPQLELLVEVGETLYDAVAFHKHRAEGEVCNTFADAGGSGPDKEVRSRAFARCREVLWAMDAKMARSPAHRHALNFLRSFGGPVHIMMRRYRFVEDGMIVGRSETEDVVSKARQHDKLWNRVDAKKGDTARDGSGTDVDNKEPDLHYERVMEQGNRLLFSGFVDVLEKATHDRCETCVYRSSYGAEFMEEFGGVKLCLKCRQQWKTYLEGLGDRAVAAFPEITSQ